VLPFSILNFLPKYIENKSTAARNPLFTSNGSHCWHCATLRRLLFERQNSFERANCILVGSLLGLKYVDNLSWTKAKMDKTLGPKMVGLKKHGQNSTGQKKSWTKCLVTVDLPDGGNFRNYQEIPCVG